MDGVVELYWQRDKWDGLHMVAFNRTGSGQLALMGKYDAGPFDGAVEASQWLLLQLCHLSGGLTL